MPGWEGMLRNMTRKGAQEMLNSSITANLDELAKNTYKDVPADWNMAGITDVKQLLQAHGKEAAPMEWETADADAPNAAANAAPNEVAEVRTMAPKHEGFSRLPPPLKFSGTLDGEITHAMTWFETCEAWADRHQSW